MREWEGGLLAPRRLLCALTFRPGWSMGLGRKCPCSGSSWGEGPGSFPSDLLNHETEVRTCCTHIYPSCNGKIYGMLALLWWVSCVTSTCNYHLFTLRLSKSIHISWAFFFSFTSPINHKVNKNVNLCCPVDFCSLTKFNRENLNNEDKRTQQTGQGLKMRRILKQF